MTGKNCEWIIDGTGKSGPNMFVAFDENLVLTNNDTFKIMTEDSKTTFYESKGFQWPGVILLNGNQKVRVQLNLSNDSYSRNFDVLYGTNTTFVPIQNIETTGKLVFPYNRDNFELKTDFKIILKPKSSEQKLLLNLETLDLNSGTVRFNKVVKYENQTWDSDKSLPDFLLSNVTQIDITISPFKLKTDSKGVEIHYDLVDSVCSQYKSLDVKEIDKNMSTIDVLFPKEDALKYMSNFRCLNIFEHPTPSAKLMLNLRDFHFKNSGDLMTVLDGNTRDSKTLAVIESHFLDSYWRDLYLYSSANKMWIMFDSPQVINKEYDKSGVGVQAFSQGMPFIAFLNEF